MDFTTNGNYLLLRYFFSTSGVTGDQMANIVRSSIEKLYEIGFSLSIITCDQGTSNRKMFSLLGGTPENPFAMINCKKSFLCMIFLIWWKALEIICLQEISQLQQMMETKKYVSTISVKHIKLTHVAKQQEQCVKLINGIWIRIHSRKWVVN